MYSPLINSLFKSYFPVGFGENEIKALTLPYWDQVFNPTARMQRLLAGTGDSHKISIRDADGRTAKGIQEFKDSLPGSIQHTKPF